MDGGVFKPKEPVELDDKSEVRLFVQPIGKAKEAVRLLKAWMEGDEREQTDAWNHVKQAIDQDRPSSRKLFQD